MSRFVVDTNVAVVANGRDRQGNTLTVSLDCRKKSVKFLMFLLEECTTYLDQEGEIQGEYRSHLSPSGQPGVGDLFYREVLNSYPGKIVRCSLERRADGEFADLPQQLVDVGFDRSDRKFAALAKKVNATVANCVDSDWLEHQPTLKENGIALNFVCGSEAARRGSGDLHGRSNASKDPRNPAT